MFLVFGCAQSPRLYLSIPIVNIQNQIDHSNIKLKVGEVVGGQFTNEFEGSKIDALNFKLVLTESLKKYNLFLMVNSDADYILNATIVFQGQPLAGLDMTVSLIVKYLLINPKNNEQAWSKEINSIYTTKFFDSLYGPERLTMANEGAIRNNIETLINSLGSLVL